MSSYCLLSFLLLIFFSLTVRVAPWPTFFRDANDEEQPVDGDGADGLPFFAPSETLLGVINGFQADPGEWPFVVSIQLDGHKHFCGGSIWNANFILTAAHCTFDEGGKKLTAEQVTVYIGHTDISIKDPNSVFKAAELIPHEKYTGSATDGYDIAVVRLAKQIDFKGANKNVFCVCQAKPMKTVIPDDCYVIGWGATHEGGYPTTQLLEVKVPLRDHAYCAKHAIGKFDTSMLCAGYNIGGRDGCQGDSGGPLACAISRGPTIYSIVGVVSYGKGCAEINSPGYYTKVHYFLDWIAGKTGC